MLANSRVAPWTGLVVGPAGWAAHHQAFSDLLHFNCHLGDSLAGAAAGALIAAMLVAAGIVSWRASALAASPARRFIGRLGAMAAAIFLFAVGLQTFASLLLPGCGP